MFSSFNATGHAIAEKNNTPITLPTNYFWSFNSTQWSGTTITSDNCTSTLVSTNASAYSTTGQKEGDRCFNGGLNQYWAVCSNLPAINPSVTGVSMSFWMKTNATMAPTGAGYGGTINILWSLTSSLTYGTGSGFFYTDIPAWTTLTYENWLGTGYTDSPGLQQFGDMKWHHFAFTYQATNFNMYFDGVSILSSTTAQTAPNISLTYFSINGRVDNYYPGPFQIDSLRIFPSVLTATQVKSINAGFFL